MLPRVPPSSVALRAPCCVGSLPAWLLPGYDTVRLQPSRLLSAASNVEFSYTRTPVLTARLCFVIYKLILLYVLLLSSHLCWYLMLLLLHLLVLWLSFLCHLSFSNKIRWKEVEFYFSKLVHALCFKLHPRRGNLSGTGRPSKSFTVCLSCQTKEKQNKHIK